MRKVLFLVSILTLTFGLAACDGVTVTVDPDPECTDDQTLVDGECVDNEDPDTTAPTLTGVEDETIYVDATFDKLAGVTANDDTDGDITSDIVVTGTVDTSATGTYFLKYSITDAAGNKTEATRYITVEVDPSLIGDEFIQNGDFSLGTGVWSFNTGAVEGGNGTFDVNDDGQGVVDVLAPNWSTWGPRLESNAAEFENGKTYLISFDAKADAVRTIGVQVGQLLPGPPYFTDFMPNNYQKFELTTTMTTYSFKLTMNEETMDGQVMFNMGTFEGDDADNAVTKVYFDNVTVVESTPDPDVAAPVLNGVGDKTIETGATFSIYEGVSAVDVYDGDLTSSIIALGSVKSDVPGEYTIVYSVSDAAGNEATATRTITVVDLLFTDAGLVGNGDFSSSGWSTYFGDGAAGTLTTVDGEFEVEVTNVGANPWSVQVFQEGLVLETDKEYQVTFDAMSTVARDINAKIIDGNAAEFANTFSLTTTMTTYSYTFTYNGTSTTGKIDFELGNISSAVASVVTFDNIKFEEYDSTATAVVADTDQVINGNAEGLPYWQFYMADWNSTSVTFNVVDGALEADVANVGDLNWNIQVYQENIDLETGVTYQISFDAMSTVARDINLKMIDSAKEYTGTFSITPTMTTYTYNFTYVGSDETGKLDFELGNINGAGPSVITLDNVSIGTLTNPASIFQVNGDFSNTLVWDIWTGEGGAATLAVESDEFAVDLTNVGSQPYSVQFFQEGIELVKDQQYKVTFDAFAETTARQITLKMLNAGYYDRLTEGWDGTTVELTTASQTFTYTFTAAADDTVKFYFDLGNINGSAADTIFFDNLVIEEFDGTEVIAGTNQTVNANAEDPAPYWFTYNHEPATTGAASTYSINETGELEVDVTNVGETNWNVQLFQEGAVLVPNATYTIVFDAMSSVDRDINVKVIDGNQAEFTETFSLTDTMSTFTYTFTYTGSSDTGKLNFELGAPNEGGIVVGVPALITFDNVLFYRNFNPQD